jgi:hypothetical protein
MIQLRRFVAGDRWTEKFVWVKHDHITFLSVSENLPRGRDREEYTVITTIGGGRTDVYESPQKIMEQMPARPGAQA